MRETNVSALIFPNVFNETYYGIYLTRYLPKEELLMIVNRKFIEKFHPESNVIVDEFNDIQFLINKIEQWAKKNNTRFSAIIGIDDDQQFEVSKRIAEHFKLNFYSERTLKIACNKFLMKYRFEKCGVPVGKYTLISNFDRKSVQKIGYPNVLKILTGNSSYFMSVNKNESELKNNLTHLAKTVKAERDQLQFMDVNYSDGERKILTRPRIEFLLEEFLEGDEYSCDFLLKNGKISLLRVVKKYKAEKFGFFNGFFLMNKRNASLFGLNLKNLKGICKLIADAFEIDFGVCMVDFILKDGNIRVIEATVRPGMAAFVHLMAELYSYTSLGILALLKMGRSIPKLWPEEEGLVVYVTADATGKIVDIDVKGLYQLGLDIMEVKFYKKIGDRVTDYHDDYWESYLGHVLVKNPDIKDIPQIIDEINRAVKVSYG